MPLGTYRPGRTVNLEINDEILTVYDDFDHYIITEHKLSKDKGELVQNNNHKRDTTEKIDTIQASLLTAFHASEDADIFLQQVRCLKSRYARDQFKLIEKVIDTYSDYVIEKALNFCVTNSLFSAVEFRNAAEYFSVRVDNERERIVDLPKVEFLRPLPPTRKRDLSEYEQVVKGGDLS